MSTVFGKATHILTLAFCLGAHLLADAIPERVCQGQCSVARHWISARWVSQHLTRNDKTQLTIDPFDSFGIIVGSIIVTVLVSVLKGKIRLLMIVSSVVMTAGEQAS